MVVRLSFQLPSAGDLTIRADAPIERIPVHLKEESGLSLLS